MLGFGVHRIRGGDTVRFHLTDANDSSLFGNRSRMSETSNDIRGVLLLRDETIGSACMLRKNSCHICGLFRRRCACVHTTVVRNNAVWRLQVLLDRCSGTMGLVDVRDAFGRGARL